MERPTGRQYEITSGAARAIVTERGATLRLYEVNGTPYTETFGAAEEPPLGCGNVLVPWPNRTGGASWTYHGETQHLEVTEPERGNAIHGLVRRLMWHCDEQDADTVMLGVDIPAGAGWPVPLRTEVRYQVSETELVVTHAVMNNGDTEVPFGLGAHPYIRAGRDGNDGCELELPVATRLPLDPESMLPAAPPEPLRAGELSGRTLGELRADTPLDGAFTGLLPGDDGRAHARLTGERGGVELWADPEFTWLQVFTPPDFAGRGGGALAVEPMTCPPDALNSGTDLVRLLPGDRWAASWGIRPL